MKKRMLSILLALCLLLGLLPTAAFAQDGDPETPESGASSYTITFQLEDGTVLQTGTVAEGELPVFAGEEPTKAQDGDNTYTFSDWNPEVGPAVEDAVYTAVFTATPLPRVYIEYDESLMQMRYGTKASSRSPLITFSSIKQAEMTNKYFVVLATSIAEGYIWDGWYHKETGTRISDGASVRETVLKNYIAQNVDGDMTLEARVRPLRYEPVSGSTDPVNLTLETLNDYPWTGEEQEGVTVLQPGNRSDTIYGKSSFLRITAQEAGMLEFEYKGTFNSLDDAMVIKRGAAPNNTYIAAYINRENDGSEFDYLFYNTQVTDWTKFRLEMQAGEAVYVTFYHNMTLVEGDCALRNIRLLTGLADITARASDESLGAVSVEGLDEFGTVEIGNSVTLKAAPVEGGFLVGWWRLENGARAELVSTEENYTFPVAESGSYEAEFQAPLSGSAIAVIRRAGNHYFDSLESAFAWAGEGDTVVLIGDYTQTADLTVPAGVTLLLPYEAGAELVRPADYLGIPHSNTSMTEAEKTFGVTQPGENLSYTLTLENATLTLPEGARLVVGGKIGGYHPIVGGTVGAHSEIHMDASSELRVTGGLLSTTGYILGGKVTAESGTVYEPLVVTDYHGGTVTSNRLGCNVSPFHSYTIMNIQSDMEIQSAASLEGYATVYALNNFVNASATIAGAGGLVEMEEGAVLHITFEPDTFTIKEPRQGTDTTVPGECKLGSNTFTMEGDVSLKSLTLSLAGIGSIDMNGIYLSLPYGMTFVQKRGTFTMYQEAELLPGAVVWVQQGATAVVTRGLQIFDGFSPANEGGLPTYLTPEELDASGAALRGRLIVDGTLVVSDGATLAGIVETGGTGILKVEGALLTATGAAGVEKVTAETEVHTRTRYPLTARLRMAGESELTEIEPHTTYYAMDNSSLPLTGYTYIDSRNTTRTVTYAAPQSAEGAWITEFVVHYEPNGAEGEMDPQSVGYYEETELLFVDFTKPGYAFTGWNTEPDGTGTPYPEDAKVTFGPADGTGLTLYAQWEKIDYSTLWSWAGDGTAPQVSLTLTAPDLSEVTVEQKDITLEKDMEFWADPTCTQEGQAVWKASYTLVDSYGESHTYPLPATGHSYALQGFEWEGTTSAEAVFVCKNCGEELRMTAAISETVEEPTETQAGLRTWTAVVTLEGQDYQDEKTETIPALGYPVTVENHTGTVTPATLSLETGRYLGETAFTVTCSRACTVAYTTDGETYAVLPAGAGTDANTRTFTLDVQSPVTVVIALKGDVNLDGVVSSNDSSLINRHIVKTAAHKALTGLALRIADVDGNGKITSNDSSLINRSIVKTAAYKALAW